MASDPSRNIPYDPLPLTTEDHRGDTLYNAPPSPDPHITSFSGTPMNSSDANFGASIPPSAATPRFLGAARFDDPSLRPRESFASSYDTANSHNSVYTTSSAYALNDPGQGRYNDPYRDDPSDRDAVPMSPVGASQRVLEEKHAVYASPAARSRRKWFILGAIAGLILIILAVVIPLYFAVIKPNRNHDGSTNNESDNASAGKPTETSKPQSRIVTGGDGSEITAEDGTKFTYQNPYGGYWYYDEEDPFNNGARAQSWSPALNETFNYGIDKIRGVNLGGWLVTEPFIVPALFEKYLNSGDPPVDEWDLTTAMRADTAGGGIDQLEEHYKTFITEKDFADIAGAGLNYVRIPIGFWAIETRGNEPFLANVSWKYFLKAIKWARKYGIRINLDLHAVPGSQNGWNHSGKLGTIGFLQGPMGYANAQRTLDVIRVLAEFISQPQYKDVVTMFGIINEPQGTPMGQDTISRFYLEAYNIIRNAGGVGQGNGPIVSLHDAFFSRNQWVDVYPNADRLNLDSHPYLCFGPQSDSPLSSFASRACSDWGPAVNTSMGAFGLTSAGEFSNAINDCGLWLNGVGLGTRYEGNYTDSSPRIGDCSQWTDWTRYDQRRKDDIKRFALASMDALQHWFFWTWKIGNSTRSGRVESPAWSYQLGLEQGWMPTDPREADGVCGNSDPWQPPLRSWQTGGAGAGNIPASVTNALAWPPASINNGGPITALPSYTQTGPIPTLPAPTFTATASINAGSGWNNANDAAGYAVEVAGCSYPDPWVNPSSAPPPLCAARREVVPLPVITPPPSS